ncbi:PadR family transcriptional regulator [Roseospira visakhapatnamensis]|uniref:DNA-binding PadR family transcriptional regulator n=1 Tax=Roseospira visakhapatnamensis TaxID=390880 RepID=A0A7W6R9H0_9PROT|nr:PadR family transcriptional regulator [Roseospira visakhapatnamensis]MBB4264399.1 DNA-binding PadR family transcriptional regulator [Roseospira visakhapatnamensis]
MPLDAKTLCLGALEAGFDTGYDIRKAFEDGPFQHFQSLSYGSIYPALNALLVEGLATCDVRNGDGRRDKKIYAITDSGRAALKAALMEPLAADQLRSDTMFAMAFVHLMTRDQVKRILDEYARANRRLGEELGRLLRDRMCEHPGHQFLLRLGEDGSEMWARCIEALRDDLVAALDDTREAPEAAPTGGAAAMTARDAPETREPGSGSRPGPDPHHPRDPR